MISFADVVSSAGLGPFINEGQVTLAAITGLVAILLGYWIKRTVHSDSYKLNVAEVVIKMMESDRIEAKAKVMTLESANIRLQQDLMQLTNEYHAQKLVWALELQSLRIKLEQHGIEVRKIEEMQQENSQQPEIIINHV